MKIFAKRMTKSGVECTLINQDLGVVVEHGRNRFYIDEDNNGELYVRIEVGTLIVKPSAANTIMLEGE